MKAFKFIFIGFICVFTFSGCYLFYTGQGSSTGVQKETPFPDATIPSTYKPVFINTSKPFQEFKDSASIVDLLEVKVLKNKVKMYFNISDSVGNLYTGAADTKWKKNFCSLEEVVGGKNYKITDFTIKEETFENKIPIAIAVVMDHSGSMGDARAYQVQDATINLVNRKRSEDAIALIKYDYRVETEVPLTESKDALITKFKRNGLQGMGYTTAILNGTMEGINQLKNASKYERRIVVVFTDGQDNSSTISMAEVINATKDSSIKIYAVDFGDRINEGYMKSLADSTGGRYYHIYKSDEFEFLFNDIYQRSKNRYYVEYTPRAFGARTAKFKLCLPKHQVVLEKEFSYLPSIGSIINLNVYFATDKAEIRKEFKEDIETLAQTMKAFPTMTIELSGHTDNQGSAEHNLKLSQQRAEAVKKAIVNLGVEKERITAVGFGLTKPISENDTEEGRAKNRRTELKILSK